jgi:hypothetical protein
MGVPARRRGRACIEEAAREEARAGETTPGGGRARVRKLEP